MKQGRIGKSDFQPIGRGHMLDEKVHDAYKSPHKLEDGAACPVCGAVYSQGRWRWGSAAADAHKVTCPACHRIADHFPSGYISLEGATLSTHGDAMLQLIQHEAKLEQCEHALQRIMNIDSKGDKWEVTTTDVHLARRIGEAIHRAFHGTIDFHYNPQENLVRVHWKS